MTGTAAPGPLVSGAPARLERALRGRRERAAPRRGVGRYLLYAILILFAIWYLTPVYVLLVTGMKDFTEVSLARMWAPPQRLNFASFGEAFEALAPNFLNSVRLAVPATIISAILGSLNGYILAKWKFRGADVIFPLILFGMFIPYQAVLIPLVQFARTLGIYGSIEGLILVHVIYGIPITTLIFRNYYAGIPNELIEAARIDGAGFFNIYRYVLFPISVSGFVVVLIWQFTSAWNDFLFAVTLATQRNWPMTVALNNLAGSFIVEWNVQMAGALLAALPTLLVFVIFGRFFIRGLLAGSLKG
jgi:glucose/mannose transport system permease protein